MLLKRQIRNYSTGKAAGTRFCDVIVEDDKKVYLEKKTNKIIERIPFEEVEMQVELARKAVL